MRRPSDPIVVARREEAARARDRRKQREWKRRQKSARDAAFRGRA